MKQKDIPYKGFIIEQWKFGNQVLFYPNFNGNAEFKDFRKCCSYIKTVLWFNSIL